ncbi:MAG: hypothetical protein JO218_13455 [Burkholderiales bacterium]|nr:hypothetical protein [Burkholderiales bacterium]
MNIKSAIAIAVLASAFAAPPLAQAADSSYKPGTVWEFSYIKTEPGQFENYMDWLSQQWKQQNEFGKKEGYLVSYHIFNVNNARDGEPDLILAIEYKDYMPNAERMAVQKKFEAMLSSDSHKMETASGERKVMRKLAGSMELQELNLK